MIDAVAQFVKGRLDNAIINRRELEVKWNENREFFLGTTSEKWKKGEGVGWRSRSFPGFTHQKVVYAMAMVVDMVLSGGQIPFMYKPSPWDRNRTRVAGPIDPKSVARAIEDMTGLTQQQFSDCNADAVYMKNVLSAALYGWTYGKFIIRNVHREGWSPQAPEVPGIMDWRRLPENAQQWQKWEEDFLSPAYIYVSVWDIFRDWEIEDLHECSWIGQRQPSSPWWLKQKIGKAYFIDQNIRAALEKSGKSSNDAQSPSVNNNPDTQNLAPALRDVQIRVNDQKHFEYWGRMPRRIADQFEKEMREQTGFEATSLDYGEDAGEEVEVCACIYNDETTVRYVRTNPSMRPYVNGKWEDPGDELAPRGVADNCKDMHNVLKGTFRAIEDNIKLSSNVVLAVKERLIKNMPAELVPGTKLLLQEDCDDARKAIQAVVIPNVTGPLMQLLGVVQKFLDDDSMVPRIAQGVREPGDQTAAEASMRQAAASKYIGNAIRNLDNGIIEPLVKAFYDYNMNDPGVQAGKGNYIVQALGFTSFQNKTERVQSLQTVLSMALSSPDLLKETKVRYYFEEIAKALDTDPDQGLKSDEEKQADQEQAVNSPGAQLEIEGATAEVDKTKSETIKNKAQAAKALADAEATAMTPIEEPQVEGGSDGLEGYAGGGEGGYPGDGAGQPGGLADFGGMQGTV